MTDISKNYNILIFGSNGWIGNKVIKQLQQMQIPFIIATMRADDYENIDTLIKNNEITHIMSFIGRTHGVYENTKIHTIDYLEKPGKLQENIKNQRPQRSHQNGLHACQSR